MLTNWISSDAELTKEDIALDRTSGRRQAMAHNITVFYPVPLYVEI